MSHGIDHPLRQQAGLLRMVQMRDDDGELVATEPHDDIAPPHRGRQAGRDLAEQVVSGGMAERIVDRLEPIEIETQQRQLTAAGSDLGEPQLEMLMKHRTVGQSGEDVMTRQMSDALLGDLALGDVDIRADDAQRRTFVVLGDNAAP